jgi:hypothetical protein
LKVLFERKALTNAAQLSVTFEENPLSKGDGNGLELCVVAAGRPVDADVGASVEVVVFNVVEEAEDTSVVLRSRRWRSSFSVARIQAAALGGGRSSTRIVPE